MVSCTSRRRCWAWGANLLLGNLSSTSLHSNSAVRAWMGSRSDLSIAQLYRGRWQIELFFKWIKQHLRIKTFYGTSPNAVLIQIWTAIAVYLLVAILKKRLHLEASLYTLLQILSLTLFEKMPV